MPHAQLLEQCMFAALHGHFLLWHVFLHTQDGGRRSDSYTINYDMINI